MNTNEKTQTVCEYLELTECNYRFEIQNVQVSDHWIGFTLGAVLQPT